MVIKNFRNIGEIEHLPKRMSWKASPRKEEEVLKTVAIFNSNFDTYSLQQFLEINVAFLQVPSKKFKIIIG